MFARAQRHGIPLHYLVLSFVYIALGQKFEFGKLGWDVQHEMVLRDEQGVAVCNHMCRIVYGHGIGKHRGCDSVTRPV